MIAPGRQWVYGSGFTKRAKENVMRRKIKLRNPFARVLASRLYRRRMIKAKKGKGSYKRRPKHSLGRRFLFELLIPERISVLGQERKLATAPQLMPTWVVNGIL